MPNALIPELNGRRLTVDVALKQPTILRSRIAELADDQVLLPNLFHPLGAKVEAGGLLYSVVQASDFFTTSIEKRTPGAEYKVVEGVDPEPKLAVVEDWGGKFQITDEQRARNDVSWLDQQTTQLANTITRKLDVATMAAIAAAGVGTVIPAANWEELVFVGPLDAITPSADRPTAHIAEAQELADLEELGVTHDLLIVHPTQARQLRTAYAEGLDDMLKSAGLEMFANPRIPEGEAYVVEKAMVGTVGFEAPLTVEVYDDRSTRSTWVQAYAVPAFAVDRPYAAKRIVLPA
ncbi:hypothetical protein MDOR_01600 [Mycolicibacterium doricum]|uniref:Phage major capsid protein n=1 Tax=Mycolicibacterium doricum TaxID=126673 RepID=A0A1X1TEH3_9MYCO|nr:major capsid protein [Mycolicibacterium doricum]MCV7267751.1 hypothetical protein [Mycolicibacterium doricum]ORV42940.1 hypothetical protein AWC01_07060 [Mycolicibacterium doricum]BBZ05991.1 hypothetical protein MDOR_01600 [Mycolicibacterium doricum]